MKGLCTPQDTPPKKKKKREKEKRRSLDSHCQVRSEYDLMCINNHVGLPTFRQQGNSVWKAEGTV